MDDFSKEDISIRVSKISEERHNYDEKLSELQRVLKNSKQYKVVELRNIFTSLVEELDRIINDNEHKLSLLSYQCERLADKGIQLPSQRMRI